MSQAPAQPELSVLLFTPDDFQTIRKTVRHLQAQTAREQIELVILCPSRDQLQADPAALTGFGAVRLVEVGPGCSTATAKARAIRELTTPFVALAEDHCYPGPTWAATLLAAHHAGHPIVGPLIENANPASGLSWANLIACFGRWTGQVPTGPVEQTPYHNTSYRRDLLLRYGDALTGLLAVEYFLQEDLRARGHQPYLCPNLRVRHVNFSRLRPWAVHAYLGGRLFGGTRWTWERWPVGKRALYIVAAPLIPLVRLRRTLRQMRADPRQWERWPRILPWLVLGLGLHALGELVGYLAGLGDTEPRYSRLETRRLDHVTVADRRQLEEEP